MAAILNYRENLIAPVEASQKSIFNQLFLKMLKFLLIVGKNLNFISLAAILNYGENLIAPVSKKYLYKLFFKKPKILLLVGVVVCGLPQNLI